MQETETYETVLGLSVNLGDVYNRHSLLWMENRLVVLNTSVYDMEQHIGFAVSQSQIDALIGKYRNSYQLPYEEISKVKVTNTKSKWVGGNLYVYTIDGEELYFGLDPKKTSEALAFLPKIAGLTDKVEFKEKKN